MALEQRMQHYELE